MADHVAIMYVGRVVEHGTSEEVFSNPQHPYTRALIAAVPSVTSRGQRRLKLSGEPPDPGNPPSGCPFHPRCPEAIDRCRSDRPELLTIRDGQKVACHVVQMGRERTTVSDQAT
jgi:oligopeptide/dipeptide ABC transporter ATP-binding protein